MYVCTHSSELGRNISYIKLSEIFFSSSPVLLITIHAKFSQGEPLLLLGLLLFRIVHYRLLKMLNGHTHLALAAADCEFFVQTSIVLLSIPCFWCVEISPTLLHPLLWKNC